MNIKKIRHKVAKAKSDKGKEKNSVPLCLCASVPDKKGFTLMELLVVIAIIGMLAGILMPTLNIAREKGRRAVCVGNLKVIGEAFNMYNIDIGEMPPTLLVGTPPNTFFEATNQIKTNNPYEIGFGYFYDDLDNPAVPTTLRDNYIEDFAVYVCPSSDYLRDPAVIKSDWINNRDTFSAYIYRAESGYPSGGATLMLSDAKPAIAMDFNDITSSPACPGTTPCRGLNHKGEYVNILFRNGNVKGVENKNYAGTPDKNGQLTLGGLSGAVDKDDLFRYENPIGTLKGGADNYQ